MKKLLFVSACLVAAALIGVRLALPRLAKRKINESLAGLEGYKGRVDDVGLSLLRGRVTLRQLSVWDSEKDFELDVRRLTADISYSALLHRELVADVYAVEPVISMVAPKPTEAAKKGKEKAKKAERNVEEKTGKTVGQLLREMTPFRVDRFEISGGVVALRAGAATEGEQEKKPDEKRMPDKPMKLQDIRLVARDLTNMSEKEDAKIDGKAQLAGGTISLEVKARPMADQPTFTLATEARGIDLGRLSPMLRWQFDVDVDSGTFELVAQAKAAEGAFKGYLKPFVKDLKVASGKGEGAAKKVKQAVTKVVAKVLKNEKTEEIATKVPFEGRFDDPKTGLWDAVVNVLRNAFVEALKPSFEKV